MNQIYEEISIKRLMVLKVNISETFSHNASKNHVRKMNAVCEYINEI